MHRRAWSVSFTVLHGVRSGGNPWQQWFNHRQGEDTDIVVFARMLIGGLCLATISYRPDGSFRSGQKRRMSATAQLWKAADTPATGGSARVGARR